LIISLIAAMDEQAGIGKNSQLPWHLASDLKRFKQLTMGHHIVMGRKTYETIGRSLPGRSMIVVTHQPNYQPKDCLVAHSVDQAVRVAKEASEDELFIIGGGDIFNQVINQADKIYLTSVHADAHADVFFPTFDPAEWEIIESERNIKNSKDDYFSDFIVYQRKKKTVS
jgi:dihydrofolate reductase